MAFASALFHSDAEQTLYERITPSDDQFKQQQARWNDLADFLKPRLKEDTGYQVSTWLQGSYKFDTQIRPSNPDEEFDIDLGVYFEWTGKDEDGDFEAAGFKQIVQNALLDYAEDRSNEASGVDDPKERCARIKFKPDFHIDVPSYHLDRASDRRALATETKGWEDSDPKAIYVWFKGLFDDAEGRAQLRRMTCYVKMWAALKCKLDARPSSIMLTVLTAEALTQVDRSDITDDDDVLGVVVSTIRKRLDESTVVSNPVEKGEDLNRLSDDAFEELKDKFIAFEDIATRANAATSVEAAAEIWTEAFEHFFPMPEDLELTEGSEAAIEIAKSQAVAVYAFDPEVHIRAVSKDNSAFVREGVNVIGSIVKNCEIDFTLTNAHALPAGSNVRWTVRNRGNEAWASNDIGHIKRGEYAVTEESAYNGRHAMDVTVYRFGQVIGRRRVEITVRGVAMPPRQLPRRRTFSKP